MNNLSLFRSSILPNIPFSDVLYIQCHDASGQLDVPPMQCPDNIPSDVQLTDIRFKVLRAR